MRSVAGDEFFEECLALCPEYGHGGGDRWAEVAEVEGLECDEPVVVGVEADLVACSVVSPGVEHALEIAVTGVPPVCRAEIGGVGREDVRREADLRSAGIGNVGVGVRLVVNAVTRYSSAF